jgi:pimeloyl-ACP methyl ester carboxylesterase
MEPCNIIKLLTQDSLQLDALLFGSIEAKVGFIFIHGLSSSAFSHNDILPRGDAYVSLFINTRGHDDLTSIKQKNNTNKGYAWYPAGTAHEQFTDCIYDIQAAVDFLKEKGVEQVYLVGHSTGCQKSVYHLAQSDKSNQVDGVILICPMSDYAYAVKNEDPNKLNEAIRIAQEMVKKGKQNSLIPSDIWQRTLDAQRFLSLYTADSIEEIFTYGQANKTPELLQKVKQPKLILLADKDEYSDRPIIELAEWFKLNANNSSVKLIKDSVHSLTDKGEDVVALISDWLQNTLGVIKQ